MSIAGTKHSCLEYLPGYCGGLVSAMIHVARAIDGLTRLRGTLAVPVDLLQQIEHPGDPSIHDGRFGRDRVNRITAAQDREIDRHQTELLGPVRDEVAGEGCKKICLGKGG